MESSRQPPENVEGEWNSNDTSGWSDFAYVDGNNTRVVVGVNSGKPTSLTELEKITVEQGAKIVNTVSIGGEVKAVVVEMALASVATFSEKLLTIMICIPKVMGK